MSGFESRYEEAQRRKREAQENPYKRGQEYSEFALIASEQKNLAKQRLEKGFELPFPREVGGRVRQPFKEMGLRSEDNPVLKYFVTLVPKGGKARASDDKATLAIQTRSKMLTLDYAYIELNREFLAALRVDCDGVFHTPGSALYLLAEAVREGRIPCLPHIVVGDLLDDGRYARPHFIWMLPQGAAVWRSDDARCRQQPLRLFDAVAKGLSAALIEIGADPAAPTMTGRMKCPTSPFWYTLTPNTDIWPTLSEYADFVDTSVSRAVLVRKAASVQSGMGMTPSNQVFDTIRAEGQRLLAEWHFKSDARMTLRKATLADHLHEALATFAMTTGLTSSHIAYITAKVADYLAMRFDASKLETVDRNRGRLLGIVSDMPTVRERQQAGGRYAGKAKGVSTFERILKAYRELHAAGCPITQAGLARASGVHRRTVIRRWEEIMAASAGFNETCDNKCIDKKGGDLPVCTTKNPNGQGPFRQNSHHGIASVESSSGATAHPSIEVDYRKQAERKSRFDMRPTKSNVALIAGERLRKHQNAFGQGSVIRPIIEDLAATYGVRLSDAEVLNAANAACATMRALEEVLPGRWMSDDEVSAMRHI